MGYVYALSALLYSNLRTQYGKAILGLLWTVLTPFMFLAVYVPIFSQNMGGTAQPELLGEGPLALPIYVLSGFIFWMAFTEGVTAGAASLASNVAVLHHSPIPLSVLPFVKVLQALLGLCIGSGMLLIFVTAVGRFPGPKALLLLVVLVLLGAFLLGLGLLLSAVTVFFRDLLQVVGTLLLLEFFATPVVWVHTSTQGLYAHLVTLNPVTPFLNLMRAAFIGPWPVRALDVALAAGWAAAALLVGWVVFERLRPNMADHA